MYLLHQSSQALRSRLEHALRPVGVTGLQYTILGLLDRHEGLSSADLSRRFFVTPQTMNQVVAGMLKRGLVGRQASEANRRILKMNLTSAGAELLARCEVLADEIELDALATVPARELEQMREHLRRLLRQLRLSGADPHTVIDPLPNAGLPRPAARRRQSTAAEGQARAGHKARGKAAQTSPA
ncbi:MAG: MarR family transcriptional regulator [Beijerinckiaceae bacterium]|nr:MarR family transcriptional regulator [Beijerinckiaceae bacterium]